jgi:hypothetical protein
VKDNKAKNGKWIRRPMPKHASGDRCARTQVGNKRAWTQKNISDWI